MRGGGSESLQEMLWEPPLHIKNFWLKPHMAGSSSRADWRSETDRDQLSRERESDIFQLV